MTREDLDFIGAMNMCDEISDDAYKKIVCHCEEQEPCEDCISRQAVDDAIYDYSRACDVDYAQIMEYIDKLPSVTPKEPILDKIRAEIEELDEYYDNDYFSENIDAMFKCNEVLQIIDKYMAESEGE